MTTSYWQRTHSFRIPDITTDIAIVGGGYVGLATAYWISEMRPDLKITLLERSFCGSGASGRNAGFLTMGSAAFYKSLTLKWGQKNACHIHKFAADSLELVHQHLLRSSPELKYERTTSLTLFKGHDDHQAWTDNAFNPELFQFQLKTGESLPSALQTKFALGYEAGPEYKVNPVQLLATMKKMLLSRKVQILENSSAFQLNEEGVLTENNQIKASQVVLALNGYFPQFHPAFNGLIVPRRAQMLAVEVDEEFDCPSLYYDPTERVYWRQTHEKVLVIGGKRLLDETGETGDFEKITPVIQDALEQYLHTRLGIRFKVINRWSGTMGFTEHELPVVDRIAAPVETFIAGGFSGHGMGLGFHAGKETAELLTGLKRESFFNQFRSSHLSL
jgi:gamma-glutamylputrescine oxidase